MQHGKIDAFAKKLQSVNSHFLLGIKDSTDDDYFNTDVDGELEFADYSNGDETDIAAAAEETAE